MKKSIQIHNHFSRLCYIVQIHVFKKLPGLYVRGMAGKFVVTSAIRKSNALLKKRFA